MGTRARRARRIVLGASVLGGIALGPALHGAALRAQSVPYCDQLSEPVYVAGSALATPLWPRIGVLLGSSTSLVVASPELGSCAGVASLFDGTELKGTPAVFGPTATQCLLRRSVPADIAVSEVFAESCPSFSGAGRTDIGDFQGPVQSLAFAVPIGSREDAISREAAYLTFGLGADGATNWNIPELCAVADARSSAQLLMAQAIGVPADRWQGTYQAGSPATASFLASRIGDPNKMIGVVPTSFVTAQPGELKILAYRQTGQSCAYWPDSAPNLRDKARVRDGHYALWGPIHFYAATDASGQPAKAGVKRVIDALNALDRPLLDATIDAQLVPQCAMRVKRSAEIGPVEPVVSAAPCGCYFEFVEGNALACDRCRDDTDCPVTAPQCDLGFCESGPGTGAGGGAGASGGGGASGGSGTSGGGGSSGSGPETHTCPDLVNNINGSGQNCESSYTVDDCGGGAWVGGVYTPTRTRCASITSAACLTCEAAVDDGTADCAFAQGSAVQGPQAGTARSVLCNRAVECMRLTNCAKDNGLDCYCGDTAGGNACFMGMANGPCRAAIEAGLETVNPSDIAIRFGDPTFGAGLALLRLQTDHDYCADVCFAP